MRWTTSSAGVSIRSAPRRRRTRSTSWTSATAQSVPLTFTDGASVGDGCWVFSAVAERTSDSYVDGGCVAAAVGLVGADGTLCAVQPIRPLWKIEGIEVQPFAGAFT
jgi:hypothetical protein